MNRSLISSLICRSSVLGLSLALATPALAGPGAGAQPSLAELTSIAEDAFIFGYPLVLMDQTKRVMTDAGEAGPSDRFINVFKHETAVATPQFRDVVRPNVDTLYSTAWLDLTAEPVVIHVPDTADRYYVLQMLDAWTNVFAAPGKRTTGTAEQDFVVVGPDFQGMLPAGLTRIDAPTNMVWIVNRLQLESANELATVRTLQTQFTLTKLGDFIGGQTQAPSAQGAQTAQSPRAALTPDQQVRALTGAEFFTRLADLLAVTAIPSADTQALDRFEAIGLMAGDVFAPTAEVSGVLETAKQNAVDRIKAQVEQAGANVNGWLVMRQDVGTYGTNYLQRAAVAEFGLGANLPEDAIYPFTMKDAMGDQLEATHDYVIHFDANALPPVNAFWSITLYDEEGYLVPNVLERQAIRDRDPLVFNQDGSLDIYVQSMSPGAEREANWLPAPATGEFNLLMRLYWPKPEVINGDWQTPMVRISAEAEGS